MYQFNEELEHIQNKELYEYHLLPNVTTKLEQGRAYGATVGGDIGMKGTLA